MTTVGCTDFPLPQSPMKILKLPVQFPLPLSLPYLCLSKDSCSPAPVV